MVGKGNSRAILLYCIDFKVIGILTTYLEHYRTIVFNLSMIFFSTCTSV